MTVAQEAAVLGAGNVAIGGNNRLGSIAGKANADAVLMQAAVDLFDTFAGGLLADIAINDYLETDLALNAGDVRVTDPTSAATIDGIGNITNAANNKFTL